MTRIVIHRAGKEPETVRMAHDGTVVSDTPSTSVRTSDCGCPGSTPASTADDGEVGRPTSNPKTERADVRLTPAQKKRFLALGGTAWLVKMLARSGG